MPELNKRRADPASAPYETALDTAVSQLAEAERIEAVAKEKLAVAQARVVELTQLVASLLAVLPPEARARYSRSSKGAAKSSTPAPGRSGETLSNVLQLFGSEPGRAWTAAEVHSAIAKSHGYVDAKSVYNALGYLERVGRIRRIGRGRYFSAEYGVGVETAEDRATDGPSKGGLMED